MSSVFHSFSQVWQEFKEWLQHAWMLLLQSVLVGKDQEAYTALSIKESEYYRQSN